MDTTMTAWPKKQYIKQYVSVRVDFSDDGVMLPRSLLWTDGKEYPIDRVKDLRSAPALKAGGQGDRYTVEICGQDRFLFFEHNTDPYHDHPGRWFVEVKTAE